MKLRLALILGFSISAFTAPLLADSDVDDVMDKLMLFNLANGLDDYEAISEAVILELDEDESSTEEVHLKADTDYMITVVCDDDCDDVDVWLIDDDGELVDSDTDSDDTAVISGKLVESGHYILKVEVVECDSEPCYVGVQAFSR